MKYFYQLPINNLGLVQARAISKIPLEELSRMPTRLFYPKYNFLEDPDINNALVKYGLLEHIFDVALFLLGPNDVSPIHIDGDQSYTWSFNIPLINCANTRTNFYSSEQAPIRRKSPNSDIHYSTFATENCKLEDSLELSVPYIMNVSQPHNIENKNATQRTSLCIRIKTSFDASTLEK